MRTRHLYCSPNRSWSEPEQSRLLSQLNYMLYFPCFLSVQGVGRRIQPTMLLYIFPQRRLLPRTCASRVGHRCAFLSQKTIIRPPPSNISMPGLRLCQPKGTSRPIEHMTDPAPVRVDGDLATLDEHVVRENQGVVQAVMRNQIWPGPPLEGWRRRRDWTTLHGWFWTKRIVYCATGAANALRRRKMNHHKPLLELETF